jgi:hypothetical protein
MFSALYYPHTQLPMQGRASRRLLKRALLMWDHLEFIVPDPRFQSDYRDRLVSEAIELIGRNHYPNDEEKSEAHKRIEEFVTRPSLPDVFYYSGANLYEVYPQKLFPDTWNVLTESKFAGSLLRNADYPMSQQAGLAVMAILADCCAGVTRSRVTDRVQAYASLAGLLTDNPKQRLRNGVIDANIRAVPAHEALISLRLSLPDIDSLTLEQLVRFRKREAKEPGTSFRKMRHNFIERIERQIGELTNNSKLTKGDLQELQEQFFHENLEDLSALNEGMGFKFRDIAKDVVVTVLAAGGTLAAARYPGVAPVVKEVLTVAGAPITLGGAVSTANKFFKARATFLRNHPLALLYELRKT